VADGVSIGAITLLPPLREWESALLRQGIWLVDRETLDELEFEHYLQFASSTDAEVDRLLNESISSTATGQQVVVQRLAFTSPLVGRDPFPSRKARWWAKLGEIARPLLNSSGVSPDRAISSGKIIPAKGILSIGDVLVNDGYYHLECQQPTADSVEYVPKAVKATITPESQVATLAQKGEWEPVSGDPFHLQCKSASVCFDPVAKSLWTTGDAWVGKPVTRKEYIERRTKSKASSEKCPGCQRVLSTKRDTEKPKPESVPEYYDCPSCNNDLPVEYLDGYRLGGGADWEGSVVITSRWLEPAPGVYPVLRAGDGVTAAGEYTFNGKEWTIQRIAERLTLGEQLQGQAMKFCWIREDGSALILMQSELRELQAALAIDGSLPYPLPVVDDEGRQVFELRNSTHKPATVKVPYARASVAVRLVDVESSRVLIAGSLELSYPQLMQEPIAIVVGSSGPDFSKWPDVSLQGIKLRAALQESLAKMVAAKK
jgi:hypothetical protein